MDVERRYNRQDKGLGSNEGVSERGVSDESTSGLGVGRTQVWNWSGEEAGKLRHRHVEFKLSLDLWGRG